MEKVLKLGKVNNFLVFIFNIKEVKSNEVVH
jgi:hypothetical protein